MPRLALLLPSVGLAALLALPLAPLAAQGGPGPTPPAGPPPAGAPAAQPNVVLGTRLFDEAVRWVAKGTQGIQQVRDFHISMEAKFELEGTRHEGPMRLWLQLPDLYRQEMTMSNTTTVKVLKAGNLWIRNQSGAFKHMNREGADGVNAVKQANDDLERLRDLTKFVTLEGLKGPGVTFEFEGEKQPSGDYARPDGGTWAKIVRRSPGNPNIYFWLAHTKDAGGVMHASYPGVVRVDGIAAEQIPTEDFLLQGWAESPPGQPRPFLYPTKIRAFQVRPGQPPMLFLQAIVSDIKINTGIDPTRFEPR
jgi:hypothetical protein